MERGLKRLTLLVCVLTLAACATTAGGLVGAGIGRASGDTTTGALIGSGIGMMIDVM